MIEEKDGKRKKEKRCTMNINNGKGKGLSFEAMD